MKTSNNFFYYAATILLALFAVSCGGDDDETKREDPKETSINISIQEMMEGMYLWNEEVRNINLDNLTSSEYDDFLYSILTGVADQDDANHDDGHWQDGKRQYFYSNIKKEDNTKSRAKAQKNDLGIQHLLAGKLSSSSNEIGFVLKIVTPGSPAAKAGLTRGSIIVGEKIGGSITKITTTNYSNYIDAIVYSPKGTKEYVYITNPSVSMQETSTVTLTPATYTDTPILKTRVISPSAATVVGYISYNSFDADFDQELISAFSKFKAEGVNELVVDLRYNGGGHVVSSAVLSTLTAGNAARGEVFCDCIYNQERVDKGEKSIYRFGEANISGSKYPPIEEANASSIDMKRVFVLTSVNTASASELFINALEGIDIPVYQIGTTTNGKNVGMEVASITADGTKYTFAPITFYALNAKKGKDYADGFVPDLVVEENDHPISDFGDPKEKLFELALRWIETGSKPVVNVTRSTPSFTPIATYTTSPKLQGSLVEETLLN